MQDEVGKLESDLAAEIQKIETALKRKEETPKIRKLKREIEAKQKKLSNTQTAQTELAEMDFTKSKPFFLWKLQFSEIFREKGGFDIVIANPPYVRQEEIKHFKPALKRSFQTYSGTADLLVYFYEEGWRLLKEKGVLTFITSNKYFRSAYGKKLRGFLSEHSSINQIIDFGDASVFDATAYASIISLNRSLPNGNNTQVWTLKQDESF